MAAAALIAAERNIRNKQCTRSRPARDAHAHEILRLEVLRDGPQPVVAGETAANFHAHDSRWKIQLVVHHDDAVEVFHPEAPRQLRPVGRSVLGGAALISARSASVTASTLCGLMIAVSSFTRTPPRTP